MQTPIRSTVRAAQQFLNDGSNVVASLMVISLLVAIVALLPLGGLFNSPAKATVNDASPSVPYTRERQEALKEQWLEQRGTTASVAPVMPQAEDVLSVEWLQQRDAAAATPIMRQGEDVLSEEWLKQRNAVNILQEAPQRQEEGYPSGFEQWPHGMIGPVVVP